MHRAPHVARPYDAVVVGAGPNGLAAAIRLAQADLRVVVFEANEQAGGGVRSLALTRPGFVHDFGAAVFPLGAGSPFFRHLPLERYGLRWIQPDVPLAHPLDGGRAALLLRSLDETAARLGRDGEAYRRLIAPLVRAWPRLEGEVLQPLLHVPRHPVVLAQFGLRALLPPAWLAAWAFEEAPAKALWAGLAAHAVRPFSAPGASAIGLSLAVLAHRVGWPIPRGGAQALTDALVAHLRTLGGDVVTGRRILQLNALPAARLVLLDVAPRDFLRMAGDRLPAGYRRALDAFQPGPGAFKLDWALDGPIPWTNAAVGRAGTVHLGGTLEEIAASAAAVEAGRPPRNPYVLLAQPSLFDTTRAPAGKHTAWAYGHVPNGSAADLTTAIEDQVERFAPGFRARILDRHVLPPADLEAADANLVGGDVAGGANSLWQLAARPLLHPTPYRTPLAGVYLCSASTPPGGGAHGMCGYHAANAALRDHFG